LKKIIWGVLSIIPICSLIVILVNGYSFMKNIFKGTIEFGDMISRLSLFSSWNFLLPLITLGITIVFMIHTITNDGISQEWRIIWVILILLGNIIVIPIYWYMIIIRGQEKEKEKSINGENI